MAQSAQHVHVGAVAAAGDTPAIDASGRGVVA